MKCGIKINKSIEAFPIFITRKNGKMEKVVFTINLLFLYYPILLGFLLFFWNDNRLSPLSFFLLTVVRIPCQNVCHSETQSVEESPAIIVRDSSPAYRLHSERHDCHSECSVSEMKNLLPRDVTLTVIYHSEKLFLEESPSNGIRRFLVFTRNDKREGFPIFTMGNTMK